MRLRFGLQGLKALIPVFQLGFGPKEWDDGKMLAFRLECGALNIYNAYKKKRRTYLFISNTETKND